MRTGRYAIYSVVYAVVVGIFIYTINPSNYEFNFLGFSLTLPVAAWFIIPVVFLALLTIAHISYNGFKIFLEQRAIKKDLANYNLLAKDTLLGIESNKEFKSKFFQTSSELTKALSPWEELPEFKFKNTELDTIYQTIKEIKAGKTKDLRRYKVAKNSQIYIKNEINKINENPKYASEILKSTNEIPAQIKDYAYKIFIQNANFLELSKFNLDFSNEDIMLLVKRFSQKDNFECSSTDLFKLINTLEFSQEDYVKMAKMLRTSLSPDAIMSIFDKLRNERTNATEAYCYVLYELQMIDELRDILSNADEPNFDKLKLLLFLKDSGKNVSIDMLYQ